MLSPPSRRLAELLSSRCADFENVTVTSFEEHTYAYVSGAARRQPGHSGKGGRVSSNTFDSGFSFLRYQFYAFVYREKIQVRCM